MRAGRVKSLIRDGRYEEGIEGYLELDLEDRQRNDLLSCVAAARLAVEAEGHIRAASGSRATRELAEAAGSLERAAAVDPGNRCLWKTLGWLYVDRIGTPERALRPLRRALQLRPDDVEAKKLMALSYSRTGRLDAAIRLFRDVLTRDPHDLWMMTSLAQTLAWTRDFDEADRLYSQVLAMDPGNEDAMLGMATTQAWRGHSCEALRQATELLSVTRVAADANSLVGDIHRWEWKLSDARRCYERALAQQPDHYSARLGLREITKQRKFEFVPSVYRFEDTAGFGRVILATTAALPLADRLRFQSRAEYEEFQQPSLRSVYGRALSVSALYHCGRALDLNGEVRHYDYSMRHRLSGVTVSSAWRTRSATSIFASCVRGEPVVEALSAILEGVRSNAFGFGMDAAVARRLSGQFNYRQSYYSDGNRRHDLSTQLSYRLSGRIPVVSRLRHEWLSLAEKRSAYYSPSNYQVYRVVLECDIRPVRAIGVHFKGELPYVINARRLGRGATAAAAFMVRDRIAVRAELYYQDLPGETTPWSGNGFMVEARFAP